MVLVVQSFSWPWRFFPSDRVLLTWSKVKDSRTYAGLSVDDLSSVVEKLDMLGNVLRDLSIILAKDWNRSIPEARIKHASAERQLTPAEAAQARLVWRLARKGFFSARRRRRELVHRRGHLRSSGSRCLQPQLSVGASSFIPSSARGRHGDRRRICSSSCGAIAGQVQALQHRSDVLCNAPHVDYAVWSSFGRKATRANKLRWLTSWRVFESTAIMLAHPLCDVISTLRERVARFGPPTSHLLAASATMRVNVEK